MTIYTDGACSGNPGPGGWGAVLIWGEHRKELSGGFRKTTNNRMEMLALIMALRVLRRRCRVIAHSDSQYVVRAINEGWAARWRRNGWMRGRAQSAENCDLWGELLDEIERHQVEVRWIRGHNGHPENERCDRLAVHAARGERLEIDQAFEERKTRVVTSE